MVRRSVLFAFVCVFQHSLIDAVRQQREGLSPFVVDTEGELPKGFDLATYRTGDRPGTPTEKVDFADEEAKLMDGHWTKCCCRSDHISEPEKSKQVMCELVVAEPKNCSFSSPLSSARCDKQDFLGCKQLKGNGYHSWNNMPKKYNMLNNFHECHTTVSTTMIDMNFGSMEVKEIKGELNKCCCRSDILSNPEDSEKIVCELSPVQRSWGSYPGCKSLRGPGYHSFNNMGEKYAGLENYNVCAISALREKRTIYKDGPMRTNSCPTENGWRHTLTAEGCKKAAMELYSLDFSGVKVEPERPRGCYVFREFMPWGIVENVFLNTHSTGAVSNRAKPICEKSA